MTVRPPRPKGPHLTAMRAFEAAARLGGFVAAAEELNVTAGAVSQHIKALEGWAGVALFHRSAQGVVLTEAGRTLQPSFRSAFDALADATHALRNLSAEVEIHIAALPSVAQLWLPPRLGKIRSHFPQLKFSVTAMEKPPSLRRDLFDMTLFFDTTNANGTCITLAKDEITPVAAPALAASIRQAEDLAGTTRLQDRTWQQDWPNWCAASGLQIDDPTDGPGYSLYSLAVEEAKSGAGVLMGHLCLLETALDSGALVPLGLTKATTGRALILTLPDIKSRRPVLEDIAGFLAT
ncbi:LysR family transcriptional regulator [Sulfitobacter mediterraneus]|nr:LysR family transcriptional regulator [Sulfitobacter mediterraneus]MBM1316227.1 LysR family transcriptional regulator [Sulfitobacter mediterraneus]MBM1324593.1 LysR family transcriptional regulator [Sulfitobacter mediterraneus]MBM1328503.1 LysR family transcriptional regulator [Sulfitobacter mediterraneus]MBM1399852.1 LysR family transcriptional regulator [Sulfitobacter mediterraneus]